MTLQAMIASGALEPVASDAAGAKAALAEARAHLVSAAAIAPADRNGAYQLAYDGGRKAVVASLRRAGLRVARGEGGHAKTAEYARIAISDELGRQLDALRRRRNRSEYGAASFGAEEIADAIATARALIMAVES